uniref:TIAM Rac1 associated GEF 1b n=1 Tax=Denticeps clupeoides TaxID=299321 RepID=A0AAY4B6Z5_9TELE
MGNVESHSGDHALYRDRHGHLSRKHMSRSLRVSSKHSHPLHRTSTGKMEHRNSETSTRSSSTPSIPQSLADHGLEPFNDSGLLPDFSSPIWVDRVAMNLRPMSFHHDLAEGQTPHPTGRPADAAAGNGPPDCILRTRDGPRESTAATFKKRRSKSADMWQEDSLDLSLSDLSQAHLTSTEEIVDTADERDFTSDVPPSGPLGLQSLDDLYEQKSPKGRQMHKRFSKWHKGGKLSGEGEDDKMLSPADDDGTAFGAYTLPCRRSHCLSEGLNSHQAPMSASRRAQTIQDVTAGECSEYEDSGIDGLMADMEQQHQSRCYKTMSATFSLYSPVGGGGVASSDTASSSSGGGGGGSRVGEGVVQGIYENFRQQLEMNRCQADGPEEASSALSDEQSSCTVSSAYQSDPLLTVAQGTVRKAGRLAVKNFLVHKKNKKVELATRRKWKSYWVSLKGCTLFFYETDGRSGIDQNSVPKHAVWAENSIVQAVPEHPKKDFVFCLSNSLGDSFLFQTCSQTELENWITAVHSACAAAMARQHHRDDTVRLLRAEIKKLEQKIDMDEKMKKMGDMQLSAVTDTKKRKTILDQIFLWEQNLEQFHMDLFRFRCYLASLQGGELPNPKRLLAFASRPTKLAMGRLGIFSVSSFHALVAARTESGVRRRTHAMSRSSSKRKSRFSSLWGLDTSSKKKSKSRPSINQVFADGDEAAKKPLDGVFTSAVSDTMVITASLLTTLSRHSTDHDIWASNHLMPSWVCLPNDQPVLAIIQPGESALDALETICKSHKLDATKHYLRLKFLIDGFVQFYIPKPEEDVYDLVSDERHTTGLNSTDLNFCLLRFIHLHSSPHFYKCLNAGDEILQLNGKPSSNLTFSDMKAAFAQILLSLTVNTLPTVERRQFCYQPPRRSDLTDEQCTDIFSQNHGLLILTVRISSRVWTSTEQVAAFCRSLHDMNPADPAPDLPRPPPTGAARQLSDADKLRKVICELVETERTYVKDLNCLIGRYLTPLQKETFLTQDELDVLFGNLLEMVEFQVEFLKTLEDGTRLVPDLEKLERVEEFKKILFSLGGSFLYYADRFKIYSAFCASHTKVPKVLVKAKTDPEFKAFLDERNPKQQHSSTLESYLIKPIQRVLKYPLLLRELYCLTDPDSEEHYHLDVAMKAMNKVASHINEMQKIHEEFGTVFDHLIAEQSGDKKDVADLSMGDLLLHTSVTWINPPAFLGKWKKEPQLVTFVFKMAVVFICKDGSKQKKKLGSSHRGSVSSDDKDPFRFRHMIPTDALQVRALGTADGEGTSMCEMVHVKSESEGRPERTFHLCCSSVESKKDFLKTVQSILRDKQRRQLLKTESLPLSQQYVPFGGKRLCALKGARPTMNRAVSAPTRTLGRRKLVRNRFTIDTDIVFDGESSGDHDPPSPDSHEALQQRATLSTDSGDTDRWVEEQFDLDQYDDPDGSVKETDILSDEEDDPALQGPVAALSLESEAPNEEEAPLEEEQHPETPQDAPSPRPPVKLSHLGKQCALSVPSVEESAPPTIADVVWVRRESDSHQQTES